MASTLHVELRKANTKLLQEKAELQEEINKMNGELDLVLGDYDETHKENDSLKAQIEDLRKDLEQRDFQNKTLKTAQKNATEEADLKSQQLAKDRERIENLKKEKEEADKQKQKVIEEKAARVDELEKKMTLMELEKDKLKKENYDLADKLRAAAQNGGLDGGMPQNKLLRSGTYRKQNRFTARAGGVANKLAAIDAQNDNPFAMLDNRLMASQIVIPPSPLNKLNQSISALM